jgi:hypothetical protein
MLSLSALAQTTPDTMATGDLERSFRAFLQDYRPEMKRRNATYLKSVHPKLPDEMQDFFFDITLQMMRYSDERGLDPAIECQEFKVCKVVYPQPDGGWAAQRFILSDDRWRWLDQ